MNKTELVYLNLFFYYLDYSSWIVNGIKIILDLKTSFICDLSPPDTIHLGVDYYFLPSSSCEMNDAFIHKDTHDRTMCTWMSAVMYFADIYC